MEGASESLDINIIQMSIINLLKRFECFREKVRCDSWLLCVAQLKKETLVVVYYFKN